MIAINLLPWRHERLVRSRKVFFIWLAVCSSGAFLLVTLCGYWLKINTVSQMARLRLLELGLHQLNQQQASQQRLRYLDTQMQAVRTLERGSAVTVRLLDSLARVQTEDMVYVSLRRQAMQLHLMGTARTYDEVTDLMRHLQNSRWFSEVKLDAIRQWPERKYFEIRMTQKPFSETTGSSPWDSQSDT